MKMQKNILLIDNFDSFTFNLVHLIEQLDARFQVVRNDVVDTLDLSQFSHLIVSPGPGLPKDAGQTLGIISLWPESRPILGVCLGMQSLIEFSGGELENMAVVQHGAQSLIQVDSTSPIFQNIPSAIKVGRYHSWASKPTRLAEEYKCTGTSEDGFAMAMEHLSLPRFGVQFHPESIMTEYGPEMMRNFVDLD